MPLTMPAGLKYPQTLLFATQTHLLQRHYLLPLHFTATPFTLLNITMTAPLTSPTSSSANATLTKAKGPAPYALHDLILLPATAPEIVQQTWTNNMEEWAKGVPLEQYHARERHLAATAFSSDNRLITWILVPKANADVTEEYKTTTGDHGVRGGFDPKDFSKQNLERILGAVETYERPGIAATVGDKTLHEVSSVSVASVYAPSRYRNHGYGKLMMR